MNIAILARYIPAAGLVGLALYHLSIGDVPGAGVAALAALTAAGIVPAKPSAPAAS